ncbi:MAG: LysE family translocator [Nitrospirota bacterium]|nr:LysE family translocator [Nitrospirota bacterium]
MHFIIFLISAYLTGCLAAIPAGPVQIEVVRRSINGHLKPSLMVVLGAFFADVSYGSIAFFGIAPFLEKEKVMAFFWLAGGLILTVLGALSIKHSLKPQEISYNPAHLKRKRWAFLGGLSLSATNPIMILWWLSGVRLFQDIGLIDEFNTDIAMSFLAAGSLGLASYLVLLSLFIFWAKKFISLRALQKINFFFGVFLLLIATYFVYTSFHSLLQIY